MLVEQYQFTLNPSSATSSRRRPESAVTASTRTSSDLQSAAERLKEVLDTEDLHIDWKNRVVFRERSRSSTPGDRAEELNPATSPLTRTENVQSAIHEIRVLPTFNVVPATSSNASTSLMAEARPNPFGPIEAAEYLSRRGHLVIYRPIPLPATPPAEPRRAPAGPIQPNTPAAAQTRPQTPLSVASEALEIVRKNGGEVKIAPRPTLLPSVCGVCAVSFESQADLEQHREDHNQSPKCHEYYAEPSAAEHRPHCSAVAATGS
jgi:hypothetical protein